VIELPYQLVWPAGRWRPLVAVRLWGPTGAFRDFGQASLDTGSDDTLFPLTVAVAVGIALDPQTSLIRWRGSSFGMRFGQAELELWDGQTSLRWPAQVGFTAAPLAYPLLGHQGTLQFFEARFLGDRRIAQLEVNGSFPGVTSALPAVS
jgi:hypothetical protein